ncbi:Uncharacterised protein [Serratia liquefaciens]|nr:Uncharacterised protein [Serratia liquefaciens]
MPSLPRTVTEVAATLLCLLVVVAFIKLYLFA